ncbi:MAG: 3D domain-containing protein [Candidatus Aminicenantes bacterium]|nr:3D domain-containing protein [Candidatus Aminicenantes bacterium]
MKKNRKKHNKEVARFIIISLLFVLFIGGVIHIDLHYRKTRKELSEVKEALKVSDVQKVTVTAYSSTKSQCDDDPEITGCMRKVRPGTVAVSRDLLKCGWVFGKKVYIEGFGIFEINDLMNKRWQRRIDIFIPEIQKSKTFTPQELTAMLLKI